MAGEWSPTTSAGLSPSSPSRLPTWFLFRCNGFGASPSFGLRSHSTTARAGPTQHRRALRPLQRIVRRVPRRDDDLFQRAVRDATGNPGTAGRRAAAQDRPAAGHGSRDRVAVCWRSEPDGVSCASAPLHGARTSARSRCRPSSSAWPSAAWWPPDWPTGLKSSFATTASGRPLRRRAVGGDDRGGGTGSGPRTSRRWNAWWRRADGWRSRPSRCRTTECWPPATRIPGSRSTSSPAGCCPRPRRSSGSPSGTRRSCAPWTCCRCVRTTPKRCGCGGNGFAGMRWRRWVSTTLSSGCGSSTWPTPRRVSARISRCVPVDLRTYLETMNFVSVPSLAIPCGGTASPSSSAAHRPLQRRRCRVGFGSSPARGRRRAGHRRPVPPILLLAPVTGGPAAGLAHVRQVGG